MRRWAPAGSASTACFACSARGRLFPSAEKHRAAPGTARLHKLNWCPSIAFPYQQRHARTEIRFFGALELFFRAAGNHNNQHMLSRLCLALSGSLLCPPPPFVETLIDLSNQIAADLAFSIPVYIHTKHNPGPDHTRTHTHTQSTRETDRHGDRQRSRPSDIATANAESRAAEKATG